MSSPVVNGPPEKTSKGPSLNRIRASNKPIKPTASPSVTPIVFVNVFMAEALYCILSEFVQRNQLFPLHRVLFAVIFA